MYAFMKNSNWWFVFWQLDRCYGNINRQFPTNINANHIHKVKSTLGLIAVIFQMNWSTDIEKEQSCTNFSRKYNGGELFKLQIHQYKSLTINSHYVHVDVLYVYVHKCTDVTGSLMHCTCIHMYICMNVQWSL